MAQTVGGDCLADVSLLRAQPEVFGPVASDPTISRLLDTLAADVDEAVAAIGAARAAARPRVWDHQSPLADDTQVIIDLDATLIGSHSEKELASPNYKRGFGFHPMMAFTDHGHGGTGEPAAALLRTGRTGANDGPRSSVPGGVRVWISSSTATGTSGPRVHRARPRQQRTGQSGIGDGPGFPARAGLADPLRGITAGRQLSNTPGHRGRARSRRPGRRA